jgi:hypothetical protein
MLPYNLQIGTIEAVSENSTEVLTTLVLESHELLPPFHDLVHPARITIIIIKTERVAILTNSNNVIILDFILGINY